MKPACLLLILCGMCGAQTKDNKAGTIGGFAESALAAFDSIRTLGLNVHTSDTGFQLRQVDAEKSLAIAEHKAKTDEERRQLEILEFWSKLIGRHRKVLGDGQSEASPLVSEIWRAESQCLVEADFIFKPDGLTEDGRKRAQTHKCVESAKHALADSL